MNDKKTKPADPVEGDTSKNTPKVKRKKKAVDACNREGCKGKLDMDNLRMITNVKYQTYCKKCGASHFLRPSKPAAFIDETGQAKRDQPKGYHNKKARRKANAEARENINRIANTGVKYVP